MKNQAASKAEKQKKDKLEIEEEKLNLKQAHKLGRCDIYLQNLKLSLAHGQKVKRLKAGTILSPKKKRNLTNLKLKRKKLK